MMESKSRSHDPVRNLVNPSCESDEHLVAALRAHIGELEYAFVVYWIPEQASDIFTLMLPVSRIATVELVRGTEEVVAVEVIPFSEYMRRNPRMSCEMRRNLKWVEDQLVDVDTLPPHSNCQDC